MQLLLGCGRSREKKLFLVGQEQWRDLVTMDMNPDVAPDHVGDVGGPLPFDDDSADEIHLYDVLEHLGAQGDWRSFFAQFAEFYRVLKPGGHLFAIVPDWRKEWAWGDPGHTRVIQPETLSFLDQSIYAAELDGPAPSNRTDYRFVWRGDFEALFVHEADPCIAFVLRAVKPSRVPSRP